MSFFSFGKKDDAPSGRDAYSDSPRGARQTVRTERRTRRTERPEADAMMLDPTLPEKQRARRRLVGALALVAAAVIILPMVLDSHPKPVTDDISIDIPSRPAAPLPKTGRSASADAGAVDSSVDTQAGVAPDGPVAGASDATAAVGSKADSKASSKPESNASSKPVETQTQARAAAPQPLAKPAAASPAPAAPAQAAKPVEAPAMAAATSKPGTPASPAGSRFVIQIGTFDEDSVAQGWVSKLKAAGVPAYVEHRKQADGTTRALLRAGPFADRAAASAALGKVRQAGLGGGAGNSANNTSAN